MVNAACAVDAGSVVLGQVKTATLSEAGKTSGLVGFNIQLGDCDTTVSTKAAIAFSGVAVNAENPNVLALDDSASDNATNVGVQVLDSAGKVLAFDGAATPGIANANANFKVQYQ